MDLKIDKKNRKKSQTRSKKVIIINKSFLNIFSKLIFAYKIENVYKKV